MMCSIYFASWLCFQVNFKPLPPPPPPTSYKIEMARVTCYKPTGYNMANTKPPKDGWVATSDRSIPFGTEIEVDRRIYKVGDRTAKWVHEKFEYPTIDIFMETGCDRHFGNKIKEIKIYEK